MPSDPDQKPKPRSDRSRSEFQNSTPSQVDCYAVAPQVPHPFQPRLIHPDPAPVDSEGELQLPDDLAALAEQLQDDVAYLSNCYPPEAPNKATSFPGATAGSSSSAPMRIALRTTAAAAIATALSIALFANRQEVSEHAERPQQPADAAPSSVPPQPSSATEAGQGPKVEALPQHALEQYESLLLLGEATGPEREGLLDLLQQTASTETGISF